VWKTSGKNAAYDVSAVKNQNPLENLKPANLVVPVRSERGYSDMKYDANLAKSTMSKKFVTLKLPAAS